MKFTIAIPVRNGELYLHSAILSAISQSRSADEIIVIDDASTDQTSNIAKSDEWGGKVKYIYNEKSSGWVDAFNRIAKLASGDYITILGSDDVLNKEFLHYVEIALSNNKSARFCYTGQYYMDANGVNLSVSPLPHSKIAKYYDGKTYAQNYILGVFTGKHIHRFAGVAIQRNLLVNECPIRKDAGLIADDDLFVRLGSFTDVVGISEPLAHVRNHSLSISGKIESLPLQLAQDYIFQIRSAEEHAHLDVEYILMYQSLALRFINQLLIQGLLKGRLDWINNAINYRVKLESEISVNIERKMSFWTRMIWKIVKDGKGLHVGLYLSAVPSMRKIKKMLF